LPQQPQANDVIGNAILDCGARGVSAVPYVPPVSPGSGKYLETCHSESASAGEESVAPISRYPLQVMGKQILVETPLIGRHQLRNIAIAIAAAEELSEQGFSVTAESIERGVRETRWPGRFQVVPAKDGAPEYVLDVAHNPAGAWALRSTLSACYEGCPLTLVFGAMRDKAIGEMAEILFPLADRVITTHADNPRSATSEEIRESATRVSIEMDQAPNVAAALDRARAITPRGGVIIITGSIYIVGEAMRNLGLLV
jgi:dihydrofolate synthase/folylpolyglutamate synthase